MKSQGINWIILWTFLINLTSEALSECTGGTTTLTASDFTVGILTYPSSSANYGINLDLCWNISANQDILISLTSDIGVGDYIKVYDGSSTSGTLVMDKTDKQGATQFLLTTSDSVFLRFTSDGTLDTTKDVGFTLRYVSGTSTACNTTLTADSTLRYLSSPNFPDKYDKSTTCISEITAASGNIEVKLIFKFIEEDSSCQYDALQFIDTDGSESAKYCGTDWTPTETLTSKGASVKVKLTSDQYEPKYGYIVSYRNTAAVVGPRAVMLTLGYAWGQYDSSRTNNEANTKRGSSGDAKSCDGAYVAYVALGATWALALIFGAGVAAYKTGLAGNVASKFGFKSKAGNASKPSSNKKTGKQEPGNLYEQEEEQGTIMFQDNRV